MAANTKVRIEGSKNLIDPKHDVKKVIAQSIAFYGTWRGLAIINFT